MLRFNSCENAVVASARLAKRSGFMALMTKVERLFNQRSPHGFLPERMIDSMTPTSFLGLR
jgi:hypothetical protein